MIKHVRKSKKPSNEALSVAELQKHINTEFIGKITKYLPEVDSTNEEAKRNSHFPIGALFIADSQTNGKGRLGREWSSEPNTGIYMSLILTPALPLRKIPQITLIAGIAVCRALGCDSLIKWPNDIVIGSKKVCGILTEATVAQDGTNCIICGIGINVNTTKFSDELSEKGTSLLIETGKKHSREKIIADVINEFEPLYSRFIEEGFSPFLDEYRSLCSTINRDVSVLYKNTAISGTAIDVDKDGRLVVKTDNDTITVTAGEVSVRGMLGYI